MLSESIRPSSDCAQWVVDEIKLLEEEVNILKQTIIERERQLVERDFQLIELRKMNEQNNEWGQELFKENERLREELIEAEKYNGYHQQACLEIERLRGALSAIAISYSKDMPDGIDAKTMWIGCTHIARSALQQKESE